MAKYKRAELMEEEDSVHLADHLKTHVIPLRPAHGMWKSRSFLEKLLILFSCSIFILLLITTTLLVRSWSSVYLHHIDNQHDKGTQKYIGASRTPYYNRIIFLGSSIKEALSTFSNGKAFTSLNLELCTFTTTIVFLNKLPHQMYFTLHTLLLFSSPFVVVSHRFRNVECCPQVLYTLLKVI